MFIDQILQVVKGSYNPFEWTGRLTRPIANKTINPLQSARQSLGASLGAIDNQPISPAKNRPRVYNTVAGLKGAILPTAGAAAQPQVNAAIAVATKPQPHAILFQAQAAQGTPIPPPPITALSYSQLVKRAY